jgi:hypothetical protein
LAATQSGSERGRVFQVDAFRVVSDVAEHGLHLALRRTGAVAGRPPPTTAPFRGWLPSTVLGALFAVGASFLVRAAVRAGRRVVNPSSRPRRPR